MNSKHSVVVAALAAACTLALAQTPNAPAGKGVVGSDARPILSFKELEACLLQETTVKKRLADHEAQRAPIDAEKTVIVTEQDGLKALRAPVDDARAKVDALSKRMQDYGARVEAWNKSANEFSESGGSGRQAESKRKQINAEREALEAERASLDTEKTRLSSDTTEAVKAFNTKATGLDARVTAWNQRNEAWNEQGAKLEVDRQAWIEACSNRRYREDDEKAIKRVK